MLNRRVRLLPQTSSLLEKRFIVFFAPVRFGPELFYIQKDQRNLHWIVMQYVEQALPDTSFDSQ